MGYWKNNYDALEQEFEKFRTEAGPYRTKNTELYRQLTDARMRIGDLTDRLRLAVENEHPLAEKAQAVVRGLQAQIGMLSVSSRNLTESNRVLRLENHAMRKELENPEKVYARLPPEPQRPYAIVCQMPHVSVNDQEAVAALRKENDHLREQLDVQARRLTPVLPPKPEPLVCELPHVSVHAQASIASLRQLNDNLRDDHDRQVQLIENQNQQIFRMQTAVRQQTKILKDSQDALRSMIGTLHGKSAELNDRDVVLKNIESTISELDL